MEDSSSTPSRSDRKVKRKITDEPPRKIQKLQDRARPSRSGRKVKRKITDEPPRKKQKLQDRARPSKPHSSSARLRPSKKQKLQDRVPPSKIQKLQDRVRPSKPAKTETAGSRTVNPDPEKQKLQDRVPPSRLKVKPRTRSSSLEWLPPSMSELRVVLLGNSWSQRSSVRNFILGENKFNTEEEPDCCLRERGQVKEKEMILINTPDLLHPNISEDKLTEHVKTCERLSDPGPHVFLLVLQPEDFTEEHKLKLCRVLQRFSDQSFDHSLVLISTPREESPGFMEKYHQHPPLKEMIRKCHYRFVWQKNLELPELLTRLGQVVKENNGEHLS